MGKAKRRIVELAARVAYLENQNEQAGQAEFEAECVQAFVAPPRDHEADFQDFMLRHVMVPQMTRLLRIAYLCGAADERTPEM